MEFYFQYKKKIPILIRISNNLNFMMLIATFPFYLVCEEAINGVVELFYIKGLAESVFTSLVILDRFQVKLNSTSTLCYQISNSSTNLARSVNFFHYTHTKRFLQQYICMFLYQDSKFR